MFNTFFFGGGGGGGYGKMNILGGIKILWKFFGVITKAKVQNGGYFWGLLKFQIFLGVLEIPDIFGG